MKQANARLPKDLYEELEEYAEEREISRSEAVRRCIDSGLDVERSDVDITMKREKDTVRGSAGQGGNLFNVIQTLLLMGILGFLVIFIIGGI